MLASNNVLFPANGEPSIVPSQDIVLGLYYATRSRINGKGEGMFFADVSEVQRAYDSHEVELQTRITVRIDEYSKNEEGEWVASKKTLRNNRWSCFVVGNLAHGLSFDLVESNTEEKRNFLV